MPKGKVKPFSLTQRIRKAGEAAERNDDGLTVYRYLLDVCDRLDTLGLAATRLAEAWENVPEVVQVPEEMNEDSLWRSLAYELRKVEVR